MLDKLEQEVAKTGGSVTYSNGELLICAKQTIFSQEFKGNPDGTYTYTNSNGVNVTGDIKTVMALLDSNGDLKQIPSTSTASPINQDHTDKEEATAPAMLR